MYLRSTVELGIVISQLNAVPRHLINVWRFHKMIMKSYIIPTY